MCVLRAGLRAPGAQAQLSELAACACIGLVASMDRVDAPLLWNKQALPRFMPLIKSQGSGCLFAAKGLMTPQLHFQVLASPPHLSCWLPLLKHPSCCMNSIPVAQWEQRSSRAAAAQVAARFNWLYHDTATYAPYATETAHVPSLLLGRKCAPNP